jgi:hypothetical protein
VILGERLLSAYRLPDGTKVWVILVTATYSDLPYGGHPVRRASDSSEWQLDPALSRHRE